MYLYDAKLCLSFFKELDLDLNKMNISAPKECWWREFIIEEDFEDQRNGPKLILLFAILKQCEEINDKV